MDDISIRQATVDDIPDLVRLRRRMFESMGYEDPALLDAADRAAAAYFGAALPRGEFYGWLALTPEGEAVGSGGAVIDQHPPGPNNLSGRIGDVERGSDRCLVGALVHISRGKAPPRHLLDTFCQSAQYSIRSNQAAIALLDQSCLLQSRNRGLSLRTVSS